MDAPFTMRPYLTARPMSLHIGNDISTCHVQSGVCVMGGSLQFAIYINFVD